MEMVRAQNRAIELENALSEEKAKAKKLAEDAEVKDKEVARRDFAEGALNQKAIAESAEMEMVRAQNRAIELENALSEEKAKAKKLAEDAEVKDKEVARRDFAEGALNQKAIAESAEMEMVRAQNRAIELENALSEEKAKAKKLAEDAEVKDKEVARRDFAEGALNQKAIAESAEMEMVRAQNRAIELENALSEEKAKAKKLAEDAEVKDKEVARRDFAEGALNQKAIAESAEMEMVRAQNRAIELENALSEEKAKAKAKKLAEDAEVKDKEVARRDFAEGALNQKAIAESAEMEMVRAQNRAIELENALSEEKAKAKKLAEDAEVKDKEVARLEARISELEKGCIFVQPGLTQVHRVLAIYRTGPNSEIPKPRPSSEPRDERALGGFLGARMGLSRAPLFLND
ncbi:uncharacterized protein LOC130757957 [Actinidia eriantha]|uniref:uncharacterized protein LOC130757957 n=1 Tax=Actinidia eriantha TaxID=165200 RepID=UPI00258EB2E1|nr:uncharacterized protein LOC130757957 [Actinidia eriantha]